MAKDKDKKKDRERDKAATAPVVGKAAHEGSKKTTQHHAAAASNTPRTRHQAQQHHTKGRAHGELGMGGSRGAPGTTGQGRGPRRRRGRGLFGADVHGGVGRRLGADEAGRLTARLIC